MLSTKENLLNWPAWFLKETTHCLSPGVWRETLCHLTPPWPPPCWALKPACWSYHLWIINTVEFIHAEQRILQAYLNTLQNLESMVTWMGGTGVFYCQLCQMLFVSYICIIFRTSYNHSILIWRASCQPGRLCTANVCSHQRRQTSVYNMESQGRYH